MGLAAMAAYESFTVGILAACPLPRDQLCITDGEHCREEYHIEREMTGNSSAIMPPIVSMSFASPNITPGTGSLTLTTTAPST